MGKRKSYNYHTQNSVQELFRELSPAGIKKIADQVGRLSRIHHLTYTDDHGKTALINLTLRPRILHSKIEKNLHKLIRTFDKAFERVASLYFQVPDFYELFPFTMNERRWLACLQDRNYIPGRLATRWDANTTFAEKEWKEGHSFFEVNGVGVGGMWYGPTAGEVAMKAVVPELKKMDPRFNPVPNPNMGRLLLGLILGQRKKIGRTRGVIALAMEKASGSNFVEFECLAKMYTRLGHPTIVIEPTDLEMKKDDLFARGKKVDIVYRDTTLSELCLLEENGFDLQALREGFRRGQVISSLEGEFDHKSAFEVFTNSEYTSLFSPKERELFRRHILWTRLLKERKTTDSKEKKVDLIPYTIKNQNDLVLKPNRLYGGKGIVLGCEAKRAEWHKKISVALKEPGEWVIQALGILRTKSFFSPVDKKIKEKDFYVVSGFFATEKGLGIVGRMSERMVVNVARRGGLTPILLMR